MAVSIIIPVLDDAAALRTLLGDLGVSEPVPADSACTVGQENPGAVDAAIAMGCENPGATDAVVLVGKVTPRSMAPEIIVVDGYSRDDSVAVAGRAGVRVLECGGGRGAQLDAGARAASCDWLWFLHADSRVSQRVLADVYRLPFSSPGWGRFDVCLAGVPFLRLTALAMNWRSALTGICTGDQGIFVHRSLLQAIGGVPRQRLMEDIELSKRLKRLARPRRIRTLLQTSARRWQTYGVLNTIALMWWLRIRYLFGAAPEQLARRYYG